MMNTLIIKDTLEKAWFSSEKEIEDFFMKINSKLQISETEKNTILKHYNNIVIKMNKEYSKSKSKICHICSSPLIIKELQYKTVLVCPNWKPNNLGCPGHIQKINNTLSYSILGNWMHNLETELQSINSNLNRINIYKILKELHLESPTTIFRHLKSKRGEKSNFGLGWKLAKQSSIENEEMFYNKIKTKNITNSQILKQQWVCYTYKNDKNIYYKCIDCIVINKDEILVYEIKNSEYYIDEIQLQNYKTLLEIMFPDTKITTTFFISQ